MRIKILLLCMFTGIISIVMLTIFSSTLKRSRFIRITPPNLLTFEKSVPVDESYYISGATNTNIYLGNSSSIDSILISDIALNDLRVSRIEDRELVNVGNPRLMIDSPYFFVADGNGSAILQGTLSKLKIDHRFPVDYHFNQLAPVGGTSIVLRYIDYKSNLQTLSKQSRISSFSRVGLNILEKQIDGLFCTDGMIKVDRMRNRVVYVYHYRNQYICMDTSLNVQFKGTTIDTVSKAQIKTSYIESSRSYTLSSPPLIVNRMCDVNEDLLFINSAMLSENESKQLFMETSVIDVYDLKNGTYLCSFYVPKFNDRKMTNFIVRGSRLVAQYDGVLLTYSLATHTLRFRHMRDRVTQN